MIRNLLGKPLPFDPIGRAASAEGLPPLARDPNRRRIVARARGLGAEAKAEQGVNDPLGVAR
jgi:hypothetical protein